MQIKTTTKYHLTPVGTASIKKDKKQVLARMWGEGHTHALLWECKLVQV